MLKAKLYLIKTPKIISSFYADYTWRFKTDKKEIYLTFDDGPTPEVTPFVLDVLKKHNAKATFFCIGKNIEKYPQIFKRILSEGHTIGNHTQNHLNGWKTNLVTYISDVAICQNKMGEHKINYKLFRPAYGKIKKKQARKLLDNGYKIIMWSVLSGDFDLNITKEKCLKNVIENTTNGAIIVFHDSKKAFKKLQFVLPKVLSHFNIKKISFKKIDG